MDFKKLSGFILAFGAVVFAMGAIWYLTNMPVNEIKQTGFLAGFPDPAMIDQNMYRGAARNNAGWTMAFGAIVALVGVAIRASAKKDEDNKAEWATGGDRPKAGFAMSAAVPNPALEVPCPFCSKPLERGTWQTYCVHCYQHLPPETKAELARAFTGDEAAGTVAIDSQKKTRMSERNMWICRECGKENRNDRTNCWHCSARKDAPAYETVTQELKELEKSSTCSKCSAAIDAYARFCPSCGAPVTNAVLNCPGCGKSVAVGQGFCKYCGFDLTPKGPVNYPPGRPVTRTG